MMHRYIVAMTGSPDIFAIQTQAAFSIANSDTEGRSLWKFDVGIYDLHVALLFCLMIHLGWYGCLPFLVYMLHYVLC